MARLLLDANEHAALMSALTRYTEGDGMEPGDEDEGVLEALLERLG